MTKRVTICSSCEGPGAAMAAALKVPGWEVRLHDCFNVCSEPVTLAVQASGKATYLFAGLTEADTADVRAFLRLHDAATDGWVDDARAAGRLRFCLKGRVPAL